MQVLVEALVVWCAFSVLLALVWAGYKEMQRREYERELKRRRDRE